ncbi:MAG: sigma-54 dependent transcriptional regulator, partial [Desulfobacterales bacterium]
MATILIIDDDDQLRESFARLLREDDHQVLDATSGESGIDLARRTPPDLAIVDFRLPGINGLETFRALHRQDPKLPVVMMTAYGTTDTVIEAIKDGVFDFILKPFDIPVMLDVIVKALETSKFMRSPVEMNRAPGEVLGETIIGQSPAMQQVYKAIGRVASTDATVLIRGESGTGKELVARAVYQYSNRSEKPFQVINCVAIPESLLESELFGHEKGAFTGAAHKRIGKVEQAHGGTIFLDEIGDMPLNLQSKLLRLLQEKKIERLGSHDPIRVDVRIIAATNRDLERAIAQGDFREDLYYRLKVVTVQLPPLRERREDIPLLADYFIARYAHKQGLKNPGLTSEALKLLSGDPWPGNVRQLANIIQKALIFNRGAPLSADDIFLTQKSENNSPIPDADDDESDRWLEQIARRTLEEDHLSSPFDALMDRMAA